MAVFVQSGNQWGTDPTLTNPTVTGIVFTILPDGSRAGAGLVNGMVYFKRKTISQASGWPSNLDAVRVSSEGHSDCVLSFLHDPEQPAAIYIQVTKLSDSDESVYLSLDGGVNWITTNL